MSAQVAVGTRVRFSYDHLFDRVTFTARVVKLEGENAWVEMPARVRQLPFPPNGGKRYGLFPIAKLMVIEGRA